MANYIFRHKLFSILKNGKYTHVLAYLTFSVLTELYSIYLYNLNDLPSAVITSIIGIIGLIIGVAILIISSIRKAKEQIIERIENANQYERHVIKSLHDELIKNEDLPDLYKKR
jgi:predicted PurR-regulated permease PerM